MALNKQAWQSSDFQPDAGNPTEATYADKAVDGDPSSSSYPNDWSCSAVDNQRQEIQWWVVDLGDYYNVTHVVLTPRQGRTSRTAQLSE